MGREFDTDPVVDIEPLGMMVHGLSEKGNLGHESEGLIEIFERFLSFKLSIFVQLPARKISDHPFDF